MPKSIQALREQRASVAKDLHELLDDKNASWTDALQAQYDEGMNALNDIDGKIKRIQDLHERMADEKIESSITEAANRLERDNASQSMKLFAKWLRGGDNALSSEEWANVRNTMSTTTASEGGYTVSTEIAKTVADALKAFGGMREVSTVLQTETGSPMNYPTSDGTSETGEQVAENIAVTESTGIVFGNVALNTYKFSSKSLSVPFELLQDSSIDIESFIKTRLVQRIGRITNTKFTTGTGSGEPKGVVTAASAGKVGASGQTATVLVDDLVDLVHSVDPAYRDLNRCRFMMHDSSLKIIRKLKDSNGRPIFLPGYDGLAGPMANTVLGYPITINQDIAAMEASAKSILFGDFSFYIVRDALVNSFFRFTDSAYAKNGQVGFLMFARSGGTYVDVGGGVKYYQNSAS